MPLVQCGTPPGRGQSRVPQDAAIIFDVRKLVLILFMAMLPLQWTAAAVASLCLPDAQSMGHVNAHAIAQAARIEHAHDPVLALAGDQASHDHGSQDHRHDGKARHAEHGGCCHASGSALLRQLGMGRLQAAPEDLVARVTVLAVSHPSESPFRPPRLALA